MKIGMNMLLWTNHVTTRHLSIIEELQKTGFEGIEIPIGEGDIAHYKELGRHVADLGLGITAVTSLLEETNIVSPDPKIRQAGVDRLKWAIEMANAAGIRLIGGPFHSAFAYMAGRPPNDDELEWSADNLRKAGEVAKQADITLVPEVLNRFECYLVNTMAKMKTLLEMVDHPNVQAMYDTHHANIEEKCQSEAIRYISDYLKHVHISENDRGTPGKGQVDWGGVFSALRDIKYNGWVTIEAFSTAIPEFANAINVWRDFSPKEEIYKEGLKFIRDNLFIQ